MKIKIATLTNSEGKLVCKDADTCAKFVQWFKKSKVVDAAKRPLIVYHGSESKFDTFLHKFIGSHATTEGNGFYFTNNKDIAKRYAGKSGALYSVYLRIQKPLNYNKKTIGREKLAAFFEALDPTGEDCLSNYGDVHSERYGRIVTEAVNLEYSSCDNDVEIIHNIMNGGGYSSSGDSLSHFTKTLTKTLGYDGIITDADWGDQRLFIVFDSSQIKSIRNKTFGDTNNINK